MNESASLQLLDATFPPYFQEFRAIFPNHKTPDSGPADFYLVNSVFMAGDAHVYYALIRHFKPARVLEIGSGMSTLVAAAASCRNASEGVATAVTAIEPYPADFLKQGIAGLSQLIPTRVQSVGLEAFTSLRSSDILFIDSTHTFREGGDVQYEYCEILPRLAPGVLVHIHDVSLPKPYPSVYARQHRYWSEQYVLQALLAHSSRFEVFWPATYLMEHHPDRLCSAFPEIAEMRKSYPDAEPSSFWMRVRPDAPAVESAK